MRNQLILSRLDDLIAEGERLFGEFLEAKNGMVSDPVRWTQWTTSTLNLFDKLSVSTNRFVREFELWVHPRPDAKHDVNIGAALGVLKSAREEYALGLAIDYHLAVASAVFEGLLDEAAYLAEKRYLRAAAVLLGAALEEALKNRAKAVPIEVSAKDTLVPMIVKLKARVLRF